MLALLELIFPSDLRWSRAETSGSRSTDGPSDPQSGRRIKEPDGNNGKRGLLLEIAACKSTVVGAGEINRAPIASDNSELGV